jgi:hypothetical protein
MRFFWQCDGEDAFSLLENGLVETIRKFIDDFTPLAGGNWSSNGFRYYRVSSGTPQPMVRAKRKSPIKKSVLQEQQ